MALAEPDFMRQRCGTPALHPERARRLAAFSGVPRVAAQSKSGCATFVLSRGTRSRVKDLGMWGDSLRVALSMSKQPSTHVTPTITEG